MMRTLLCIILTLLIFEIGFAQKKKSKSPSDFTIQQLADGIWAAIHNDQYGKAICNAGIIDLGDKTLVFDPFMNPGVARELKTVAEQLTGKPVTIVVNSHFHNDHIRGNQVFFPTATIISTTYTRNQIAKVEPEQQEWEKNHAPALLKATRKMHESANGTDRQELPIWIAYYEGMMESNKDLKITLPDIVFNDSLWILGSARSVKLVEFKNGHTASDLALFIPSAKIAFLGDLLFVKRHPWLCDGEPSNWKAILNNLYDDPSVQTLLPGHGTVCNKQGLKDLEGYIGTVQKLANSVDSDSAQAQLLAQPIPSQYHDWYFGRFYQPNLRFVIGTINKHLISNQNR